MKRQNLSSHRAPLAAIFTLFASMASFVPAASAAPAPAKRPPAPAASTAPAEDAADLVLQHGLFYPVDAFGPIEGSLVVRKGRIVYLGPEEASKPFIGPKTRKVDLLGRAVTPGLIDAHSHLLGLGRDLSQVDLRGAASFDEVVRRVRAAAAKTPAGAWVRGRGWDQNLWPGQAFPDHAALSAAVPDHPVWLTRIDGHAAVLNAQALARVGLTDASKDPSGGRYLRDAAGHLSGVLVDNAMDVPPSDPAHPGRNPFEARPEELQAALVAAGKECVALGLTTVTDMGVDAEAVAAYQALREKKALPLRTAVFLTDEPALLQSWFQRGPLLDKEESRLTVRGVKLYADGALGSRGAALIEPYADDPGNLGLLTSSQDHMADVVRRAVAAGFQVGIHAIGDRGNLVALDALEQGLVRHSSNGAQSPKDPRCRIEHAQVMRLVDIERMARLGIIASMQPTHATSDMPWAPARLGERRLAGAYAWRKVLAASGRLALGSDFPVESADPRLGLYAAVTRQDLAGQPAGGWLPGEKLTRIEALRGFTLDAARSLFLEDQVGSLTVGKRADLVVWGRDPMTVPEIEIPKAEIDFTYVDGERVFARAGVR
ncbi:MAG TPA: amidohydrolase [Thermoanaerobaculia bacterium]|nr:amidohydrolase [Thermoanaerobaculia bacterium]